MKTLIAASLLWIALVLSACSPSVQLNVTASPTVAFTAVPVLTSTVAPTETAVSPTETPDVVLALMPEWRPASEWKGIPVMPGATAGEGDDEGYVFTIKAAPQQVREFYELELAKLGWQPFATGDGDSSLILMYMDGTSASLTVSIIGKGEEALVLLVK